jgi:hypothetical protein
VSNGKMAQSKDDSNNQAAPSTPAPKVGLLQLFKFATPLDVFLILTGLFLGKWRSMECASLVPVSAKQE